MNMLTPEQLLVINATVINQKNEISPDSKCGELDEVAQSPYVLDDNGFFVYRTTIEKAAKLGCEIYSKKPFASGNGKTSVLALLTLLEINGFRLENYQMDIVSLAEGIKKYNLADVIAWIKKHLELNIFLVPRED